MEEIEIINKFEAAYEKFMRYTKSELSMEIILKGHICVEHELKNLLYKYIDNTKRDSQNNPIYKYNGFANTYKLLYVLNALPKDIYVMVDELNRIRNNYAHNLEYEFEEKSFIKIEQKMPKKFKEKYMSYLSSGSKQKDVVVNLQFKVQTFIFTIWEFIISQVLISKTLREQMGVNNFDGYEI